MNHHLHQGLLVEMALAIHGEFDLQKLLHKSLPLLQRGCSCLCVGVVSDHSGTLCEELFLPRGDAATGNAARVLATLATRVGAAAENPALVIDRGESHDHIMRLPRFGYLVLTSTDAITADSLAQLSPLAGILGRACLSCVEEHQGDRAAADRRPEALIFGRAAAAPEARSSEQELRLQEAHYQALFTRTSDAIAYFDTHQRICEVNNHFSSLFGYAHSELIGRDLHDIVDEHGQESGYGAPRILAGETVEREVTRYARDGRALQLLLKGGPVSVAGEIIGGYAVYSDIGKRLRDAAELRQQARLQQILMEIASIYINLPLDRVEETINRSLADMATFVGADRAYIFRYDFVRRTTSNTHEWCAPGIEPQIDLLQQTPMAEFPDWLSAHLQGLPMYVPDVLALPAGGLRNILEPQGIKSVLAVPMMNQGDCVGFVGFDAVRAHHEYSDNEQHLLQLFAQMLVNVQLRQQDDEKRKVAERALHELNQTLEQRVEQRTAELNASHEQIRSALVMATESEAAARQLARQNDLFLTSINEGFFGVDERGRVTFVNPAAAQMFGQRPDQLIGSPVAVLAQLFREDPFDGDGFSIAAVLASGVLLPKRTLLLERRDGRRFPIEYQAAPIIEEGKTAGAVVVFADITERRILEQQLLQAQKMEAVGQLASGIAHEINTPLQYIQDNLSFLRSAFGDLEEVLEVLGRGSLCRGADDRMRWADALAAPVQRCDLDFLRVEIPASLRESLAGIGQMVGIVSAMKTFSHPGTTQRVPVDINRVIESAVTVSRNEWKLIADVDLDLEDTLPLLHSDQGTWGQILLNLIVNSAHAIAEQPYVQGEKGRISIHTRQAGDAVELVISDTGCGIPREIQNRIFEPFFTTKGVGRGTGQGLAIVYDLVVNKHGGSIHCDSTPGQGTSFTIAVPVP